MSAVTGIAYLLKDIAAVCALLYIYHFFFLSEIKLSKVKAALILCAAAFNAFFCVCVLSERIEDSRAVMDFVSYVIYIVCLQVFSDNKRLSKSIWTVTFFMFTVDMLYALVSDYLGEALLTECLFDTAILSISCVLIYCSVKKMQLSFLPEVFAEIPKWIYAVIMLFDLTCYYKEIGEYYTWYKLLYLISSISVVLCLLYLVFKIFYLAQQQNDILRQIELQKEYGEKVLLDDKEIRRFRHDYKNHMIVVKAYLESGRMSDAREYISSIDGSINGVMNRIRTGNFVSDALLNSKATVAAKTQTSISFSGYIPPTGIRSDDLCTVLSNLIDNAIEACEKVSGDRSIAVEAKCTDSYLILSITNPTVTKNPNKLRTSKKDTVNHGLGIKNVERAIKRYNGVLSLNNYDNIFTADVRLTFDESSNELTVS